MTKHASLLLVAYIAPTLAFADAVVPLSNRSGGSLAPNGETAYFAISPQNGDGFTAFGVTKHTMVIRGLTSTFGSEPTTRYINLDTTNERGQRSGNYTVTITAFDGTTCPVSGFADTTFSVTAPGNRYAFEEVIVIPVTGSTTACANIDPFDGSDTQFVTEGTFGFTAGSGTTTYYTIHGAVSDVTPIAAGTNSYCLAVTNPGGGGNCTYSFSPRRGDDNSAL